MEIKNVVAEENTLMFTLADTTPSFANALRRTIVSLVPTLAIEEVEFTENNSALYDEVIAHRLGLMPLTTDLKTYKAMPTVKEGLERAESSVVLTLEAKGPGLVTADQMVSKDPSVKCAFPKMPIVKLLEGQSIAFSAKAVMGKGIEHMKWAAGAAHYQHVPVVKDGNKSVEVLPKDVINQKNQEVFVTSEGTLNNANISAKNPTAVERKENDFIFTVESWGQIPPKEMLVAAMAELNEQIDTFDEALKSL
jgi:DNA-directed RNA polymerase subunit D